MNNTQTEIIKKYKLIDGINRINLFKGDQLEVDNYQIFKEGTYFIRLDEKIIIPPLPLEVIKGTLTKYKYASNGDFKKIYDPEKGVLETLTIEGPFEIIKEEQGEDKR